MTKTKRQLRAEAVERLKEEYDPIFDAAGYKATAQMPYHELIDLLTDDEPPEGDAVAILREAACNVSDYNSAGEALRRLTDTTNVHYALEAIADMVERDYVRAEDYNDLALLRAQAERERDHWQRVAGKHAAEMQELRKALERERPHLLAKDGKPIEVGEVLYGLSDGMAWEVERIDHAGGHPVIGVNRNAATSEVLTRALKPEWLTHEPRETVESLLQEVADCGNGRLYKGTRGDRETMRHFAERIEKLAKEGA